MFNRVTLFKKKTTTTHTHDMSMSACYHLTLLICRLELPQGPCGNSVVYFWTACCGWHEELLHTAFFKIYNIPGRLKNEYSCYNNNDKKKKVEKRGVEK